MTDTEEDVAVPGAEPSTGETLTVPPPSLRRSSSSSRGAAAAGGGGGAEGGGEGEGSLPAWEKALPIDKPKDFFIPYLVLLTDNVIVKHFMRPLREAKVITERDEQIIENKYCTNEDKADELLKMVGRHGPVGIRTFMNVLGRRYPYIFQKMTGLKPTSPPAPVLRDSTLMLRDSGYMVAQALSHLTNIVERDTSKLREKVEALQHSLAERTMQNKELEEQLREQQETACRYREKAMVEKEERLKVMQECSHIQKQNENYVERLRNLHDQLNTMKTNLADDTNDASDQENEPEEKRRSIAELEEQAKEVVVTIEKFENSSHGFEDLQKSLQKMLTKEDDLSGNNYVIVSSSPLGSSAVPHGSIFLVKSSVNDSSQVQTYTSINPHDGQEMPSPGGKETTQDGKEMSSTSKGAFTRTGAMRGKKYTTEVSRQDSASPAYESVTPYRAAYLRPVVIVGDNSQRQQLVEDLVNQESAEFTLSESLDGKNLSEEEDMQEFAGHIKEMSSHVILPEMESTLLERLNKAKIYPIIIILEGEASSLPQEVSDLKATLGLHEYESASTSDPSLLLSTVQEQIKAIQGHLIWVKDHAEK